MPLFFFDLYDGETAVRDAFGAEMASVHEAAEQAAALLPDLMRAVVPNGPSRDFAVLVRGEDGTPVYCAASLLRGRMVGVDPPAASPCPPVDDPAALSREIRDAARCLAERMAPDVSDLLALLSRAALSIDGIAAGRSAAGARG